MSTPYNIMTWTSGPFFKQVIGGLGKVIMRAEVRFCFHASKSTGQWLTLGNTYSLLDDADSRRFYPIFLSTG